MTNLKVAPAEGKLASLPKAKLVERKDITEDLMIIKLEPESGVFDLKPGQ